MKEVLRIDEYHTAGGVLVRVEITFADGSKVSYAADKIERTGNL